MARPRTLRIVARYPYGFFFNTVLFGAQATARQHGTKLLVLQGTPESIVATQIARSQADAWIAMSQEGVEQLIAQGKPVVTVGAVTKNLACPAVVPDNRGGVEAAMLHLFEHGHERIGFVDWAALGDIAECYEGYRAALAKRGLPLDERRVVVTNGPLAEEGARAASLYQACLI
jgi:DNA-binding LacI/PurR family transcriptional regulator